MGNVSNASNFSNIVSVKLARLIIRVISVIFGNISNSVCNISNAGNFSNSGVMQISWVMLAISVMWIMSLKLVISEMQIISVIWLSVRIRSFSGSYFLEFGLNTERYSVSLYIQSKCSKIRTRKSPNTVTFYAVSLLSEIRAVSVLLVVSVMG